MYSEVNAVCAGGEVVEPVDRVSLLWPVLAGGLCQCASVVSSTRWLVCLFCGNLELQADERPPDPPAWVAVVHSARTFNSGRRWSIV